MAQIRVVIFRNIYLNYMFFIMESGPQPDHILKLSRIHDTSRESGRQNLQMKHIYFFNRSNKLVRLVSAAVILTLSLPAVSKACACGCSVFSVGSMWMMPNSSGLRMALTYDYMDQRNELVRLEQCGSRFKQR